MGQSPTPLGSAVIQYKSEEIMAQRSFAIKQHALAVVVAVAAAFSGSVASAATVVCPDPMTTGQTRQYSTTGAVDCVWGNGNIGQGQPLNDAFLLGQGTNDALYGNASTAGPLFSRTWTTIDSADGTPANNVTAFPGFTGLTFSNVDDDSFDWVLTATGYTSYALGLVDGGDPKWAVFLLSGTSGTASISTQQGGWSHVVLYGSNNGGGTDDDVIPEPASLALVGMALTGLALSRRRGRKQ